MVCNGWKEWRTIVRYARLSFGWFIYTWASMKFFQLFTVKKTRLPLPAEKLACLYIQWVTYKYAMREEGLWKNRVFVPTFLVYCREIKGSETLLLLIFSEKRLIVHENISPAFHWWRENVATYGKNKKAYLIRNFFVYLNDEIPSSFSNWEPGVHSKLAHTYYVFPLWSPSMRELKRSFGLTRVSFVSTRKGWPSVHAVHGLTYN